MDKIKIVSAYAKDAAQNLINNSRILYMEPYKNRTEDWLKRTRLQLPVGLNQLGSIGMVSYANTNVNASNSATLHTNNKITLLGSLFLYLQKLTPYADSQNFKIIPTPVHAGPIPTYYNLDSVGIPFGNRKFPSLKKGETL